MLSTMNDVLHSITHDSPRLEELILFHCSFCAFDKSRGMAPKTTLLRPSSARPPPAAGDHVPFRSSGTTLPLPDDANRQPNGRPIARTDSVVNSVQHFQQFSRLHFIGRWKAEAEVELQGWWRSIHRIALKSTASEPSSGSEPHLSTNAVDDAFVTQQVKRLLYESQFFFGAAQVVSATDRKWLRDCSHPLVVILHFDMDAFFCSVTLSKPEHAQFRHQPVVIASGTGGSEISSCNYVARRLYGVKAGMWVSGANKSIEETREQRKKEGRSYPDVPLVPLPYDLPRCKQYAFDVYRRILEECPTQLVVRVPPPSREDGSPPTVLEVPIPLSFQMEVISVDDTMVTLSADVSNLLLACLVSPPASSGSGEANDVNPPFPDKSLLNAPLVTRRLTDLIQESLLQTAVEFAVRVRTRVWETTCGCTASVGIGSNYMISRLATGFAKPNGICVVVPPCVTDATAILDTYRTGCPPPPEDNALCAAPRALLYHQHLFIAYAVAAKDLFGVGPHTLQRLVELFYVTQAAEVAKRALPDTVDDGINMLDLQTILHKALLCAGQKHSGWSLGRDSLQKIGVVPPIYNETMRRSVDSWSSSSTAQQNPPSRALRQMRFTKCPGSSSLTTNSSSLLQLTSDPAGPPVASSEELDEVACRIVTYTHHTASWPPTTRLSPLPSAASQPQPRQPAPHTFERAYDSRVDLGITRALHRNFQLKFDVPPRPTQESTKPHGGGNQCVGAKRPRDNSGARDEESYVHRVHEMYEPPVVLAQTSEPSGIMTARKEAAKAEMSVVDADEQTFQQQCLALCCDDHASVSDKVLCVHIQRLSLKQLREAVGRKNGALIYCFCRGVDFRRIRNSGGVSSSPSKELFSAIQRRSVVSTEWLLPQLSERIFQLTATASVDELTIFTSQEHSAATSFLRKTMFTVGQSGESQNPAHANQVGGTGPLTTTSSDHQLLVFPAFEETMANNQMGQIVEATAVSGAITKAVRLRVVNEVSHVSTSMNYACRPETTPELRQILFQLLADGLLKANIRMITSSSRTEAGIEMDEEGMPSTADRYERWMTAEQHLPKHVLQPSSEALYSSIESEVLMFNSVKVDILERLPTYPIHPHKYLGVGRCVTKTLVVRCEASATSQPPTYVVTAYKVSGSASTKNGMAEDSADGVAEDSADEEEYDASATNEAADGVGRSSLPGESLSSTWARHRHDTVHASVVVPVSARWTGAATFRPIEGETEAAHPMWLPLLDLDDANALRADFASGRSLTPNTPLKRFLFWAGIETLVDACMTVLSSSLVQVTDGTALTPPAGGFLIALPDVRGASVSVQRLRHWVRQDTTSRSAQQLCELVTAPEVQQTTACQRDTANVLESAIKRLNRVDHRSHTMKQPQGPASRIGMVAPQPITAISDDDDDEPSCDEELFAARPESPPRAKSRALHNSATSKCEEEVGDGDGFVEAFKVSMARLFLSEGCNNPDILMSAFEASLQSLKRSSTVTRSSVDTGECIRERSTSNRVVLQRHLVLLCAVISTEFKQLWLEYAPMEGEEGRRFLPTHIETRIDSITRRAAMSMLSG